MTAGDVTLNNEIQEALKRYLTQQTFEERFLEHPEKALSRTSFIEFSKNQQQDIKV